MNKVSVIGGGLAGAEAAIYLARRGVKVNLFDMKPEKRSPAHKSGDLCELVCSNSLKSDDVYGNAAGLLKEEMRLLGSIVTEAAANSRVPAGGALAVDRNKFAGYVTERIKSDPNITFITKEITEIDPDEYTIIATGPLTSEALSEKIKDVVGGELSFFDASAPIVSFESIDMERAFFGDRYGKGNGDHINCPMNKEEYEAFIEALLSAERVKLHSFEKTAVFEGCMPVEIMAARGKDTLRFGPLKPVGLTDPATGKRAYACLQLRKEDESGTMYNLVGFQTNLLWGEQKRVLSMIPALRNAEYYRYGVMHENIYINSPAALSRDLSLKGNGKIFFAGQITGVEGYVESAACGIAAAINVERRIRNEKSITLSENTVIGALIKYVTTANCDFQPMNANFGILPPLDRIIGDKKERKRAMAERSLSEIKKLLKEI